jgi:hypothetical protein
MSNPVDRFYEAVDKAESAFREMFGALNEGGADLSSEIGITLRRAEDLIGKAREHVENFGLAGEGD